MQTLKGKVHTADKGLSGGSEARRKLGCVVKGSGSKEMNLGTWNFIYESVSSTSVSY